MAGAIWCCTWAAPGWGAWTHWRAGSTCTLRTLPATDCNLKTRHRCHRWPPSLLTGSMAGSDGLFAPADEEARTGSLRALP